LNFANALHKLRTKAKLTRYHLAIEANADLGHLGRLERGERRHPSRELVLRLGQALLDNSGDISLEDVNQLLRAAGHGPLPKNRISIRPYQ
jgi:transcriptional regulator with XRE-family HTH domain